VLANPPTATPVTVAIPAIGNWVNNNDVTGNTGNGIDAAVGANEIDQNTVSGNHLAGVVAEAVTLDATTPATPDWAAATPPTTAWAGWS